jgi:uncharacterized membrane protein
MNETSGTLEKKESETPALLQTIENAPPSFDGLVNSLHRPVSEFMQKNPAIHYALSGAWLGHPLHPAIVPIPIGAWATGIVLDIADTARPSRPATSMATVAYKFGLAGAGLALLAGLAEWTHQEGQARRVTFIHAISNLLAAGLVATSLFARARGARRAGFALAALALGSTGVGGWLGGELTYRYGAGVER